LGDALTELYFKTKMTGMPYLIDGHNLIPKISGLKLTNIDDEMQLIELLQEFCRLSRKQVEVFFDNAPPGQSRVRTYGTVVARFVRSGGTADQAIQGKLKRLGRAARNWSVVSSDREVQEMAHAAHARVIPAEEFATQLLELLAGSEQDTERDEKTIAPEEIDEWLDLFGGHKGGVI
jgi:predicted RNA-binding protein with PIN domain